MCLLNFIESAVPVKFRCPFNYYYINLPVKLNFAGSSVYKYQENLSTLIWIPLNKRNGAAFWCGWWIISVTLDWWGDSWTSLWSPYSLGITQYDTKPELKVKPSLHGYLESGDIYTQNCVNRLIKWELSNNKTKSSKNRISSTFPDYAL